MTDWNKAIYTDNAPADHEQAAAAYNPAALIMSKAKEFTGHAAASALDGLNPLNIPAAIYDTGSNVVDAVKAGDPLGAIGAAVGNPPAAQERATQRANDAYDKGNHAEGALHSLFSVLPVVGPTADSAYTKLLEGVRDGDTGKIGDAVGSVGALLAPEALKYSKKLPASVSDNVMASAGDNYYKTLLPIDQANKVPAAQSAARQLAEGPAPVASSRQSFIDKMSAGANAAGQDAKAGIDFDTTGKTGPVRPLLDALDDYARDKYTSPHAAGNGRRVPINMDGLAAIQDLKDRLVGGSTGQPTPGLVAPGQTPPPNGPVTTVALEHTEKLRRGLEQGTLNNKGDWRTDINPDSVTAMDRSHAKVIRDWQAQHAPEMQDARDPYRMFAQMRDRAQEVKNKLDMGAPKQIPIVGAIKSGEIPKAIQNSAANVPWNTWVGNRKAKLSKAIKSGDWGTVSTMLQAAKLGVGADDDGQ